MKKILSIGFISFFILGIFGCTTKDFSNVDLKEGVWKAELSREDGQAIVFNFRVEKEDGKNVLLIQNGEDQLKVDSIRYENDSVYIHMPFFDSHFVLKNEGEKLTGEWVKNYSNRVLKMPFEAVWGDSSRIPSSQDPTSDISGTWDTRFAGKDSKTKAIGLFDQQGNTVTGTFLTPVGDLRFLQGVLSGDTLKLSGFDGSHALYFSALIKKDSLTEGKIYSLNSPVRSWKAAKKEYAELPEAFAVNEVEPGTVKLDLDLKDMRTLKQVSLDDPAYKNRVVILSIVGSWCPNCMDEASFLTSYYKENKNRGVEIIGIDFERTTDFDESKKALNSFFNHFDIQYPILFSGVASSDPELTEKTFAGLPVKIHAFPTSIFLDKSGYVRKVHAGYNGPATGKYYEEFKEEFKGIVEGLLAE